MLSGFGEEQVTMPTEGCEVVRFWPKSTANDNDLTPACCFNPTQDERIFEDH